MLQTEICMQRTHLHEAGKDQPVRGELRGSQSLCGLGSHPCPPELSLAGDPAVTLVSSSGDPGKPTSRSS